MSCSVKNLHTWGRQLGPPNKQQIRSYFQPDGCLKKNVIHYLGDGLFSFAILGRQLSVHSYQQGLYLGSHIVGLFGFLIGAAAIGISMGLIRKWLTSSRNENLVSKTYKNISSSMAKTSAADCGAVIHSATSPEGKNVGAPFSMM